VRNVLIAIGNSGNTSIASEAERLLDDASPLVRGAAVWALGQLLPRESFAALRKPDSDDGVQDEWIAALA
jgi:epoxyqueuosine reductase